MNKNLKTLLLCFTLIISTMVTVCCSGKEDTDYANINDIASTESPSTEPASTDKGDNKDDVNEMYSVIYKYEWLSDDGSFLVCDKDGDFKYYRSADDLTDSYFEGAYRFYVGAEAVEYITTKLSDYGITEDTLNQMFEKIEDHTEDNFFCLVLNNKRCIIDGKNVIDSPYKEPYFGFYMNVHGNTYLDLTNMASLNFYTFRAK